MFDNNGLFKEEKIPVENRCVVKVSTSCWSDHRGMYSKKRIQYVKRKCIGFNILEDWIDNVGATDAIGHIINLDSCPDGVYEVTMHNITHDFESGRIDSFDLLLEPYYEFNSWW